MLICGNACAICALVSGTALFDSIPGLVCFLPGLNADRSKLVLGTGLVCFHSGPRFVLQLFMRTTSRMSAYHTLHGRSEEGKARGIQRKKGRPSAKIVAVAQARRGQSTASSSTDLAPVAPSSSTCHSKMATLLETCRCTASSSTHTHHGLAWLLPLLTYRTLEVNIVEEHSGDD